MTDDTSQFELPEHGFVFWPVGNGDSTTITVDDETVLQVDLHYMTAADDDDDPHTPVVDRLEEALPQRDDKPYLAVFVLSHPDQDHCLGFADLLDRVEIGELWFTPRVFREYAQDLCDDATAFRDEAKRRVRATIDADGEVGSGDRVRLIGYDDLLKEDDYQGFPSDRLTVPGNAITELDGQDHGELFRAFVHAPFKEDSAGDRNDTSVALQITLLRDGATAKLMLLGDLRYPTIRNIFTRSDAEDLEWNVMLAAHHCSKSVMYWQSEDDEAESLKQDILDDMEEAALEPGYIVASSKQIPSSDESGADPPHAKARKRYVQIVPTEFMCTQEYPNTEQPEPIFFKLTEDGLSLGEGDDDDGGGGKNLTGAVAAARGSDAPPKERVGFGRDT